MKTRFCDFDPMYRAALVAVGLLASEGCGGEHPPVGAGEDHIGHVIPAHKPAAFPDAIRRLRELNDQFVRDGIASSAGASPDQKLLHIALDIANWLPEIAADSDLPEAPWNDVNVRSATIVADYQAIVSGDAANVRGEVENAGAEIGKLETILLAADPRWFAGSIRVGAASSSDSNAVTTP